MSATLTVGETRAAKEAAAAWQRYASACRTGGTAEQRRWAFAQALRAERKVSRLELAHAEGR